MSVSDVRYFVGIGTNHRCCEKIEHLFEITRPSFIDRHAPLCLAPCICEDPHLFCEFIPQCVPNNFQGSKRSNIDEKFELSMRTLKMFRSSFIKSLSSYARNYMKIRRPVAEAYAFLVRVCALDMPSRTLPIVAA